MTLFSPEDIPAPDPPEPRRRVRMVVAYDGSGFRGFAENRGVRTVGATLREALERVLGHPVELTCAGRTDAGVHAWGQVISFDARADGLGPAGLAHALNRMLGPAVAVRSAAAVADGFDARHDAVARRYRYQVLARDVPDPFLAATAWHVAAPLDLAALRLACDPLIGEHDFAAFCRRPKPDQEGYERRLGSEPPTLVRRVLVAQWIVHADGLLCFDIEASAFCHRMVRSIVGTLVEVGRGRRTAGEILDIIRSRDRSRSGDPAPPHGLCLRSVRYADGWAS
ncbi:tRNA pseudouridine(38-40) synthase TruA [soil metagenome]